jgi:hypothetical protein
MALNQEEMIMKKGFTASRSLFIKDLIRRVHQELLESQKEREECGEVAIFEVEKMTIEVNFVVTDSKEAKGGLDFKIITIGGLDLGGKAEYQQQQVHKIVLSLTALPNRNRLILKDLEESGSRFMPREE